MKLWIRVDAAVRSDPNIAELAERLKIPFAEAGGMCIFVWGAIAEHRPNGDISGIPFSTFDRWAGHTPRKGFPREAFGKAFVEIFTSEGEASGWHHRQGALIEKAERERARKRRGKSAAIPRKVSVTERNGTERNNKKKKTPAASPTGAKESRLDVLPKADCDLLFEKWSAKMGAIPYARFRKAFLTIKASEAGRLLTTQELSDAIEAFSEFFEEQDDKDQRFITLEKGFVDQSPRWVRLGKMPNAFQGELTERGLVIGTKSLRLEKRGAA